MTRLVLDAEVATQLSRAQQPVDLCDPQGTIVGTFYPRPAADLYQKVRVPFSKEALDAAAREPGGRSLREILADLEKR